MTKHKHKLVECYMSDAPDTDSFVDNTPIWQPLCSFVQQEHESVSMELSNDEILIPSNSSGTFQKHQAESEYDINYGYEDVSDDGSEEHASHKKYDSFYSDGSLESDDVDSQTNGTQGAMGSNQIETLPSNSDMDINECLVAPLIDSTRFRKAKYR